MAPAGLPALLAALREAGLAVGPTEVLWLRAVFDRTPDLPTRERLQSVLRAVLVKSEDDRARFERVFDAWYRRADEEWRLAAAGEHEREAVPVLSARSRPRRPRPGALLLAAGWALLLAASLLLQERPPLPPKQATAPETPPAPPLPSPAEPAGPALTADQVRQRTFEAWVPTFEVTPAPWPGWGPLGLALAALGATAGLGWWQRRRPPDHWVPAAAPLPPAKGPPRRFLPPPAPAGPQLLARPEQEAMVWGIDHFVGEEPTRRLDLAATVRATVRAGGVPRLVFRQARHAREVWLWVDETADDPTLLRAADEVEEALRSHGLPVERASFRGVPQRLVTAEGGVFAPSELDERRDAARVAVLTDGRQLARQAASDRRRVAVDALLRQLSHWPRLAFVDFSRGEGGLAPLLAPHGLARIAPEELAGFLGGGAERAGPRAAGPEVEAWAAACALSPAPVAEETALALRRRLFPRASPWALAALRAAAPGPPGRLWWSAGERVRLLNRLSAAEQPDGETVAAGSRLDRALAFWEERYARVLPADEVSGHEEAALPATPAERRWLAERLLLQLWRAPGKAVRRLYELFRGGLQEAIGESLALLTAADSGDAERVRLPWSWAARPATEQVLLAEMGFGGGRLPRPGLRQPGRVGLALGIGLGLAAGGVGAAVLSGLRGHTEPPVIVRDAGWPADAEEEVASTGAFVVTAATRSSRASELAPAGAEIRVRWVQRERRCVETVERVSATGPRPAVEIWRCGRATPPFPEPWLRHLLVVLFTVEPRPELEELALELLDSGSAQSVIVSSHSGLERLRPPARWDERYLGSQVLVLSFDRHGLPEDVQASPVGSVIASSPTAWLVAPDPVKLMAGLRFTGRRTLPAAWPGLETLQGDPSQIELRGLGTGPCRPGEILQENGFTFVRICGGAFTMGSEDDDPQADGDERPAHEVAVSEFWMAQTETTERQYRGDRLEKADLPATEVSWKEARAFCARFGYRLPTEAEWEYAARAGTRTPWSFGSDEKEIGRYAWYGDNTGLKPEPVRRRLPNPWGLYDMHGNVWEWVEDWYDRYEKGAVQDPTGPATGEYRVLRGGSFLNSPRNLRSAFRFRYQPEDRFLFIGFRCVRAPRRQP